MIFNIILKQRRLIMCCTAFALSTDLDKVTRSLANYKVYDKKGLFRKGKLYNTAGHFYKSVFVYFRTFNYRSWPLEECNICTRFGAYSPSKKLVCRIMNDG